LGWSWGPGGLPAIYPRYFTSPADQGQGTNPHYIDAGGVVPRTAHAFEMWVNWLDIGATTAMETDARSFGTSISSTGPVRRSSGTACMPTRMREVGNAQLDASDGRPTEWLPAAYQNYVNLRLSIDIDCDAPDGNYRPCL
jgi:hypothetical protein